MASQELVPNKALTRVDKYISLTAMSLPDGLDFDHWSKIADGLSFLRRSIAKQSLAFYVGDWLNYGDTTFTDMADRYAEAIEATGYNKGTLYNCKRVAQAFPPDRRKEELTWSHHAVVAPLPQADQDYLLETAVQDDLTVAQLRQLVAAMKNGTQDAEAQAKGEPHEPENEEEKAQKEMADSLAQLKRDIPIAQQMSEEFFTMSNAFLETMNDAGNVDRSSVANFMATAKSLSETTNRIFKDLASLT